MDVRVVDVTPPPETVFVFLDAISYSWLVVAEVIVFDTKQSVVRTLLITKQPR